MEQIIQKHWPPPLAGMNIFDCSLISQPTDSPKMPKNHSGTLEKTLVHTLLLTGEGPSIEEEEEADTEGPETLQTNKEFPDTTTTGHDNLERELDPLLLELAELEPAQPTSPGDEQNFTEKYATPPVTYEEENYTPSSPEIETPLPETATERADDNLHAKDPTIFFLQFHSDPRNKANQIYDPDDEEDMGQRGLFHLELHLSRSGTGKSAEQHYRSW